MEREFPVNKNEQVFREVSEGIDSQLQATQAKKATTGIALGLVNRRKNTAGKKARVAIPLARSEGRPQSSSQISSNYST